MKRILVIIAIAIIYYFTIFKILWNTFGTSNMVVFIFANLIAFAFIYQWLKGQMYQL